MELYHERATGEIVKDHQPTQIQQEAWKSDSNSCLEHQSKKSAATGGGIKDLPDLAIEFNKNEQEKPDKSEHQKSLRYQAK